ncbi:helix-turn-helix domain-containing protein [Nocardioides flavescens]|uniref:HTH luxR-type domain-containing protein n=1 Tax=Nocardioides flavescens TaxID=2691959 RepID=A0A6L7F3I4_9ACTN|nr:helix-turn-helix transcriptional regulator [Nocardioides flavescens]MXG91790.1 hypothetical protein [Nocardioides flavescens]
MSIDQAPRPGTARPDGLTPREVQTLRLIGDGLTNAQIAASTGLSINTVKTYVRSAYRRLDITLRSEAVAWAAANLPPR